jgi:hypothetical protein
MPSTSKNNVDEETDQVLQAIILADSFNKRFKPLTTDRPKVYASSLFSLRCLNRLASVFFLSVMLHCWIGH